MLNGPSANSPPPRRGPDESTARLMASSAKTLCDWSKKDFANKFDLLKTIVDNPRFACVKCGRAACEKKWLCKGKALAK